MAAMRILCLLLCCSSLALCQRKVALLIGIENYGERIGVLQTPISDATAVQLVLRRDFGFEVDPLPDATRDEITGKFESYIHTLHEADELLIYFGGHGFYDKDISEAYWLPVDADPVDRSKWLSGAQLKQFLKRLPVKKVLVVSDSCFSGMLSRGFSLDLPKNEERDRYLEKLQRGKSRVLLASGGNEPVADQGGRGKHSVFASAFLKGLDEMEPGSFSVDELFENCIQKRVSGNADQLPVKEYIPNSGHEEGSFVFVRKNASARSSKKGSPTTAPVSGAADLMTWQNRLLQDPSPLIEKDTEALAIHQRRLEASRRGESPAALNAADELVARYPRDPRQRLVRAVLRGLKPDWAGSEEDASAALAKLPDRADAYLLRGLARLNLRRFEASLSDFDAALKLDPKFTVAYYLRCSAHNWLQRPEAAIADCSEFIRRVPDLADGYVGRGMAYGAMNNFTAAIEDYSKVIELQPGNPFAYASRGDYRFAIRDFSGALADYDKAVALGPAYPGGYTGRARAKSARYEFQSALEDINKAIQLAPNLAMLYLIRSQIENATGDVKAAQEDFAKSQKLSAVGQDQQ